jgi:simple sugar transport system ATP-binding protein/ribose transport system ATP-binding protein
MQVDNTPFAVQIRSGHKRFGSTQALDNVNFALLSGEVHGFAGENGAGKSTLAKVISGQYFLDSGILSIEGKTFSNWDTSTAQKNGIVLIAQELSLVPEMSVAENVFLGIENHYLGILKNDLPIRFQQLEKKFGLGIKGSTLVKDLSIAERQKVEILRALARSAKTIIMDEPTSSLTVNETQKLHSIIQLLKKERRTIIYVSHFLESLLDICDRITVMRDGQIIRTCDTKFETKTSIVKSMLGREMAQTFPERFKLSNRPALPKLEVQSISTSKGIKNVSLKIFPGEIVGLAGLVGSGRTEIARAIFGLDSITSGKIFIDGQPYENASPAKSVDRGLAFIPEDRRAQGLVMTNNAKRNISLPHLASISKRKVIKKNLELRKVKGLIEEVSVSPRDLNLPVTNFSGGNQQKILFAKWLFGNPSLIILDEPTRGVDIGAKIAIYRTIVELARRGAAILMISSEHAEVLELSNRVYLVSHGSITATVDPINETEQDLLYKLFGLKTGANLEK